MKFSDIISDSATTACPLCGKQAWRGEVCDACIKEIENDETGVDEQVYEIER